MRYNPTHEVHVTILALPTHQKVILHQARDDHERRGAGEGIGLRETLVGDLVPDASRDLLEQCRIALRVACMSAWYPAPGSQRDAHLWQIVDQSFEQLARGGIVLG